MTQSEPIKLVGGIGSPYTQKMVALLRFRRIPYAINWAVPTEYCDTHGIEKPKPIFEPTFFFDECGKTKAVCDSTPIIRRLEEIYTDRAVLPTDPALAFIDYLIEDFADEWCTKYMFHYRWGHTLDTDNAGTLLPLSVNVSLEEKAHQSFKYWIQNRQAERLHVVGSNKVTQPAIEASFRRFLVAMENHFANQNFILGGRPGPGDFGLYGQLRQLVGFDPTSRDIAHKVSPRTVAWVDRMSDQSGLEPSEHDWIRLEEQPESLRALMDEIGRVFTPAQLANAKAVQAGESQWETVIDGVLWRQKTFAYQAKCLRWTNEHYQALSELDRARVDVFLAGTGVEAMLC